MTPTLVTAPASLPVSLEDVKDHCRLPPDQTIEDTLLQGYISAATAHLDGYNGILGRCMVTQTWAVPFKCWDYRMVLPFPNVQSVALTYRDTDEIERVFSADNYNLLPGPLGGEVWMKPSITRPSLGDDHPYPITATIVAGWTEVPDDLKQAILMLVASWYEHREAITDIRAVPVPFGYAEIIAKYRWVRP